MLLNLSFRTSAHTGVGISSEDVSFIPQLRKMRTGCIFAYDFFLSASNPVI